MQEPRPENDIATLLNSALALHRSGGLADALEVYRQVLAREPQHFDALHLRGVALMSFGQHALALDSFDYAIETRADYAEAHNNRGLALAALKRFEEAVASYDRAIALSRSKRTMPKPTPIAAMRS